MLENLRVLEGPLILAASRTATTKHNAITQSGRLSFAKIAEPMEVPNLLDIQKESYDWLIGADSWKEKRDAALEQGRTDVNMKSGLEEVFEEFSPIEDSNGTMSLSFSETEIVEPSLTVEQCKDRSATYAASLYTKATFLNNKTLEMKTQTIFIGELPMMTEKGTFISTGTERVVVSQLVRSPGVYFEIAPDKDSGRDIFSGKFISSRGAYLEFDVTKDKLGVRLDRKRRLNGTVLLKALGWTEDKIKEEFGQYEAVHLSLAADADSKTPLNTQEECLVAIYRRLRPSEPYSAEAARQLLNTFYFQPKRYDLAKVGRFKINQKLGLNVDRDIHVLTEEDIYAAIHYICLLHQGAEEYKAPNGEILPVEPDDIDHFQNRRVRTVGELVQNVIRAGLNRMERIVQERMTTNDIESITPQTLINIRPVTAAIKEFFGTDQLSQFMDQNNPLAELTHKRRLSALGKGGLSRERAGMEVRDVHPSHYGRMCPIETPEGPNIGLIGSLASFGRVNTYGFIETPYRRVVDGVVTDQVDYLSAGEEDKHVIAQANAEIDENGHFVNDRVLVRVKHGDVDTVPPSAVDYMDVSPRQMVSVATALIPFLEHDDASRALMGANMQRQAVPLLRSEAPFVGTGMEYRAAVDVGDVTLAKKAGTVTKVAADMIEVDNDDGTYQVYPLEKFQRSNAGNCVNQRPIVKTGDHVEQGTPLADGPCTDNAELALGRNLLVAFMPWEGLNYEDAIILNQRLVSEDILTSIHIEEYEVDARKTENNLGPERITNDIPNVNSDLLAHLDDRGVVRVGAEVKAGDILVGKVTPKGEDYPAPEQRLLRAIFGDKSKEERDSSLKVPHGNEGIVIGARVFERKTSESDTDENHIEMPSDVLQMVRVYVAQKRKVQEGDKLAGRHGNKGVISRILPPEDMPFLEDGTPVDIILNPLGVPSRMNVGQVLENHLGWIAHTGWDVTDIDEDWAKRLVDVGLGKAPANSRLATPVFDGANEQEVTGLLAHGNPTKSGMHLVDESGKAVLYDGRSGEPYPERVGVGYMYILKLHHLVDDKIHARATGPYSMITQQPLGGKAQFGGQRFGEMEVWALEAYGAAWALQEMLTLKSDDTIGRVNTYEAIVRGENIPTPGIPESFKVLVKEMKSLCLDVEIIATDGNVVDLSAGHDDKGASRRLGFNIGSRPNTDLSISEDA